MARLECHGSQLEALRPLSQSLDVDSQYASKLRVQRKWRLDVGQGVHQPHTIVDAATLVPVKGRLYLLVIPRLQLE